MSADSSEIAALEWPVLRAWLNGKNPTGLAADLMEVEVASAIREVERLRAIVVDLVSDLASTEATHEQVYYTWEGIVRRADGMVADIIRKVSVEDDEWTWDRQLP